jgi:hypothetical protein
MTDHHDVIGAFVDNEPIEAEDLAAALATPDGRDYLIDLLVLRGLVADGGSRLTRSAVVPKKTSRYVFWLPAIAAALITIGVGAGFIAGRLLSNRATPAAPASDSADISTPAVVAPAPTHVIRMETGVNWNERSGGN